MTSKDSPIVVIFGLAAVLLLIASAFILVRWANSVTLQTKIISPKPGIECIVVSAGDSTAVDCWSAN